MNIEDLTPEQLEQIQRQLEEKRKAEADRINRERDSYKQLVDTTVPVVFKDLQNIVSLMVAAKKKVFADTRCLVDLKTDLYNVKDRQKSHTFTTEDNSLSVTIGYRVVDGWDDTASIGVQKVKEALHRLAKDEESAVLVDIITDLLRPDSKGNLKANRVLELRKRVDKIGDPEMIDGVNIIQDAYKPQKSCAFISATYRDENGREHNLPLSMSAVPLEE